MFNPQEDMSDPTHKPAAQSGRNPNPAATELPRMRARYGKGVVTVFKNPSDYIVFKVVPDGRWEVTETKGAWDAHELEAASKFCPRLQAAKP